MDVGKEREQGAEAFPAFRLPETPSLASAGRAYSGLHPSHSSIHTKLMYDDDGQVCNWIRTADGFLISLYSAFFVLFVHYAFFYHVRAKHLHVEPIFQSRFFKLHYLVQRAQVDFIDHYLRP
jgi:hypothetical protein